MKIAIDISPTAGASGVRGIGAYTKNLTSELLTHNDVNLETFKDKHIPNADLLHIPYFDIFFHTLPLIKKLPTIVTIHDVIPLVFKEHYKSGVRGKYNFYLQKLALRGTKAVICDSLTSKHDIAKYLHYPLEKIYVVYLAPGGSFKPSKDLSTNTAVTKKFRLPEKFFLFVGDVNWNKNIISLMYAIKKSQVNLVMVGKALLDKNLQQVQELNAEIKKLKLENKIIKTGFVTNKELCSIYNLAEATIVPSFYEGFGLPVLESMACGTPVICSNTSSLKEISGSAAVTFQPTNSENITNAIAKYLTESSVKRKERSLESLHQASKFTWKKVGNETIDVYKRVLSV